MTQCDTTRIARGSGGAARAQQYLPYAEAAADRWGVPLPIVIGTIWTESNWTPSAVSSSNAQGMMQVLPTTGVALGKAMGIPWAPFDVETNLNGGTLYLSKLYRRWGTWERATASYFAGAGGVATQLKTGQLNDATQRYADAVLGRAAVAADACTDLQSLPGVPVPPRPANPPRPPRPPPRPRPGRPAAGDGGMTLLLLMALWAGTT